MSLIFLVFLLLPTMVLAYAMLATFYGPTRAFYGLAWIPLALFAVTYFVRLSLADQQVPDSWTSMAFLSIGWTSLLQAILGGILTARAYYRKRTIIGLLFATALVLLPFIFRG
ncbi:MAG: hypothetical protein ABIP75_00695 [Pyrinomonadaceae bacterium]